MLPPFFPLSRRCTRLSTCQTMFIWMPSVSGTSYACLGCYVAIHVIPAAHQLSWQQQLKSDMLRVELQNAFRRYVIWKIVQAVRFTAGAYVFFTPAHHFTALGRTSNYKRSCSCW